MGKISDAFERHKKEKSVKIEDTIGKKPERLVFNDSEEAYASDLFISQKYSDKLIVLSAPHSVDAENFKTLRARILFAGNNKSPRTIMVASAIPGEGKTFVSANLAVSIALGIDEYVLLVDCDLRRSDLHEMLGYTNPEGLNEYLTGEKELSDLIIRTQIGKLSLLPGGNAPPNPSELLASARMEAFLEEVKGRYEDRFIVIDSPPSQITSEANVLARHVDGVILVVMAHRSPRAVVSKTIDNLGREKILGVVFNGYSQGINGYYKYYKKYYKQK